MMSDVPSAKTHSMAESVEESTSTLNKEDMSKNISIQGSKTLPPIGAFQPPGKPKETELAASDDLVAAETGASKVIAMDEERLRQRIQEYRDQPDDAKLLDSFWRLGPVRANNLIPIIRYMHPDTKILSLEQNDLKYVSREIYDMVDLEFLSFGRNKLTKLKTNLSQLVNLTTLFLDNNRFQEMPVEIFQLTKLQQLSICNNSISHLPDSFAQLPKLTTLYLSDNDLPEVPNSISTLSKLQQLYLHNNNLVEVPPSYGKLSELKTLDLSGNRLSELPSEFVGLTSLQEFYTQHNNLKSLDTFPLFLLHLSMLNITANDLDPTMCPPGFDILLRHLGCVVLSDFRTDDNDVTGIHQCTLMKNEEDGVGLVERIIRKTKDVRRTINAVNSKRQTALHMACLEHKPRIATMLVKFGIDLNIVDENGFLACQYIGYRALRNAKHDHPFFGDKIAELYSDRGMNAEEESLLLVDACINPQNYGRYGFEYDVVEFYYRFRCSDLLRLFQDSAMKEKEGAVKAKLAKGSATPQLQRSKSFWNRNRNQPEKQTNPEPDEENPPLLTNQAWTTVEGSQSDETESQGPVDENAADMSELKEVEMLISLWIQQLDFVGETVARTDNGDWKVLPLHAEAVKGRSSTCSALMEAGATMSRNNHGKTPVHMASESGNDDVLVTIIRDFERLQSSLLSSSPCRVEDLTNPQIRNAHQSAKTAWLSTVEVRQEVAKRVGNLIAEFSAGVESGDVVPGGKSPLFYAIRNGNLGCIRGLVDQGASVKRYCLVDDTSITAHDVALHCYNSMLHHYRESVHNSASTSSAAVVHSSKGVEISLEQIEVLRDHPSVQAERSTFAYQYFFKYIAAYLILLTLVTMAGFDMLGKYHFDEQLPFRKSVDSRLLDTEYGSDVTQVEKNFFTISDEGEVWDFIEGPFLEGMFPSESASGVTLEGDQRLFIDYSNRVVGQLRFRQLRTRADSCEIDADFAGILTECRSPFSSASEGTVPFGPNGEWTHSTSTALRGIKSRVSGEFGKTYPGSGYVVDIDLDPTAVTDAVTSLKEGNFVDKFTRVLFIEYAYVNSNGLLLFTTLMVEFPATGGVFPTADSRILRLDANLDFGDIGSLLELLVCCLVFFYMLEEAREMYHVGVGDYFNDFWNYLDAASNLIFLGVVLLRTLTVMELNALDFDATTSTFTPFQRAIRFQDMEQGFMSLFVMMSYFRLLKYFETLPSIGSLVMAVTRTIRHRRVLVFLFFFAVVMVAFLVGHYMAFGNSREEFQTPALAGLSLIRALFGDFEELTHDQSLHVIFFVFLMVLSVLILMNLFIAVLSEVYADMFGNIEHTWNLELTKNMAEYLRRTGKTRIIDTSRIRRYMNVLTFGLSSRVERNVEKSLRKLHIHDDLIGEDQEAEYSRLKINSFGDMVSDVVHPRNPFRGYFPQLSPAALIRFEKQSDTSRGGDNHVLTAVTNKMEKASDRADRLDEKIEHLSTTVVAMENKLDEIFELLKSQRSGTTF